MTEDQQKEFFNKTFTLQGRMFFPHILQPQPQTPDEVARGKMPKYKMQFAWPKNSNAQTMQALGAFINEAKEKLHAQIPWEHFVNPVKDFDTYRRQDGKPNAEFLRDHYWLNPATGFAPVVVGPDRQPVVNPADVYSGRNCVVQISFYNLTGKNKDGTAGKRGLSTNIHAVMLLEGGAPEGTGVPTVNPDEVFGNFAIDSGLIQQGGQAPAPGQAPSFGNPAGPQQGQVPNPNQQYQHGQQPAQGPQGQPGGYGNAPAQPAQGQPPFGAPAQPQQAPAQGPQGQPPFGQPANPQQGQQQQVQTPQGPFGQPPQNGNGYGGPQY